MGRLAGAGGGVLLGALGAALYFGVVTGSPGAVILAYLAQLPLFAAGLWLGVGAAAAAGLTASVILLAASDLVAAALFAALYAAPVVLLVRLALLARSKPAGAIEWYPPGMLAGWLAGLGLAMLAAALLCLGGPSGIEALLRHALAPAIGYFADASGVDREALTAVLVLVIPGFVIGSWMMMTVSNAILAQGVLARFGLAWRPSPDLATLVLPNWVTLLLAIAAVASLFGGAARFVGINLMLVLATPVCLAGLAVLHAVMRRLARPQVPLVIFYVLAGLFGWPLLVIAIVGLLDAPLGLRRRFARPRSVGGPSHD
ncbi:MAG TPA: DUF2232 domain-containing protein [Stellaceae bacterium]|nr:DUF2232 domain-containing protein [Stellaceae bacterium]